MTKILYVLVGVYTVMHCTIMSSYTPTPKLSELGQWLAASQWLVPTLLLALLVPKVAKALTPILKVRFWTVVGLVAVATCIILQLLNIPGLWWAWSTLGLLVLVVIVVANLNSGAGRVTCPETPIFVSKPDPRGSGTIIPESLPLKQVNSLLLGLAVMFLGIAGWEMLYQTGLLVYHDFFGSGTVNYVIVVAENLTWVIPALIIILVLYKRYGNFVHANIGTLACAAMTIVLTAVWFVGGMEIPLLWYQGPEGIVGPIVNVMAEPYMISVSRGSQSFWVLGVATLFIEGGNQRVRST